DSVPFLEKATGSPFSRKAAHSALAAAHLRLDEPKVADRHGDEAEAASTDAAWPDPYLDAIDGLRTGLTARLDRGERRRLHGERAAAARMFREILDEHPTSDEARLGLAKALVAGEEFDQAERELSRLLDDHPDHSDGRLLLGVLLLEQGRHAEAE